MPFSQRAPLYEQIEQARQRPLICYVTSIRPNASGSIAADALPQLIKQLKAIDPASREVDFMVVSYGGDGIVAARIISLLRERFDRVAVLVPYVAYSAATLIALGADEIVMHPYGNLGPVDPQLTYERITQGGQIEFISYGTEDLRNYFDFVREEVGISDQEQLSKAFELVCREIGSIPIGIARRSGQLSLSLGEKLLKLHMSDGNKAKAITETLSRSYHHHGYPLGLNEAKNIGLPVVKAAGEVENLMWQIWQDIEAEMECNTPFDPIEVVFRNNEAAQRLGQVVQLSNIPANLPPDMLQQLYNFVMQHIQMIPVNPVEYNNLLVTLESARCMSEFKVRGIINATRLPDMRIALNITRTYQGWTFNRHDRSA
jgi:hypothetical protein